MKNIRIKFVIITLLIIVFVVVFQIYLSNTDDNQTEPQMNWIYRPTLIYEGQAYSLNTKYQIDINTLNLNYMGILIGEDTLEFSPRNNFEANTLVGNYLFVDNNDTSNRYVYVSPSLSVDDSNDLVAFKR